MAVFRKNISTLKHPKTAYFRLDKPFYNFPEVMLLVAEIVKQVVLWS